MEKRDFLLKNIYIFSNFTIRYKMEAMKTEFKGRIAFRNSNPCLL